MSRQRPECTCSPDGSLHELCCELRGSFECEVCGNPVSRYQRHRHPAPIVVDRSTQPDPWDAEPAWKETA